MNSWWDLGEWSGYDGNELALHRIECPFCKEKGNFSLDHHSEKKKPNSNKKLNFDTYKCGNCAGYVMVLWSTQGNFSSRGLHNYEVLPWPLNFTSYPKHWPDEVGRYWLQTKRNQNENFDAAVVMARSAMQAALRDKGAIGGSLKNEIDYLASKGELPPLMRDWAHNIRVLGNESAHPEPGQASPNSKDVSDLVRFLDFLLEYLYTLPHRIKEYRERKN